MLDNETGKESEVRARDARDARDKAMVEVFGPPAKNPLHAAIRKLSKELYDEVVRGTRATEAQVEMFRARVATLAEKVWPSNPKDRAWEYYDEYMDGRHKSGPYALGQLHRAIGMVAGAEERSR